MAEEEVGGEGPCRPGLEAAATLEEAAIPPGCRAVLGPTPL